MSLYIFDKDKTVLRPRPNRLHLPLSPSKPEDQVLRAGLGAKLAQLRAQGHAIALASNQPKVATGQLTFEEAEKLMEDCARKMGGVNTWRFSPYDPSARLRVWVRPNPYARDAPSRKPHPGMLLDIMKSLNYPPEETIMVGNNAMDQKAAQNAGVAYMGIREFLG